MQTSETGLAFIRTFEALRLTGYLDAARSPVPTIGWGHTAMAGGAITYEDGTKTEAVIVGKTISLAEAKRLKQRDMTQFETAVLKLLKKSPRQHEFDAMVSLTFNIGSDAFKKSSILRKFNAGDVQDAANAFLLWNKSGGRVLAGLTRRREGERALFLGDFALAARHAGVELPKPRVQAKTEPITELQPEESGSRPDQPGTPAAKSTTIWSQIAAILTTVGTAAAQVLGAIDWRVAAVITTGVVVSFGVWTISERLRHSRENGV